MSASLRKRPNCCVAAKCREGPNAPLCTARKTATFVGVRPSHRSGAKRSEKVTSRRLLKWALWSIPFEPGSVDLPAICLCGIKGPRQVVAHSYLRRSSFRETEFGGQRQRGQNCPVPVIGLCGDRNADGGARQFGAIRQQPGNLA